MKTKTNTEAEKGQKAETKGQKAETKGQKQKAETKDSETTKYQISKISKTKDEDKGRKRQRE